jgi:hypothetical protein
LTKQDAAPKVAKTLNVLGLDIWAYSLLGGIANMSMITRIVAWVIMALAIIVAALVFLAIISEVFAPARKLHAGMTMSQVREALGTPQLIHTNGYYQCWTYDHWYGRVAISFGTNGVAGKWMASWPESR